VTFAAGGALAGLLLLVPLVLLHLRRRGQTVREVPSLLLWDEIELADARGARGLRPPTLPLLLALQALALALLVLGLAEPTAAGSSQRAGRIIVIDDSWRMQAPGRIAQARSDAAALLEGAPASTPAAVVLAGESASVLYRGEAGGVPAALARVKAGPASADLAGALTVAGALLGSAHDTIALIRAPEDPLPALDTRPGELRAITLPGPLTDVGLFDAGARCGIGAGQGCEVYATLTNTAGHSVDAVVSAAAEGHRPISLHIRVAGHASAPLALEAEPGERVSLRLAGSDALPGDDSASVAVPGLGNEPSSSVVTLVGSPSVALATARAFAAVPGVRLALRTPSTYRRRDALESNLVILDHWLPRAGLPPAPAVLLIDPPSLPEGRVGGALAETTVSGTDTGSQLLAGVSLSSLSIDSGAARRLDPPRWLAPVIWSPSGILLAAGAAGSRRLAVMAFEPGQSNLPQLPALPILAANLVRWAAPPASADVDSKTTATSGPSSGAVDLSAAGSGLGRGAGSSEEAWFLAAALAALVCEWLYWVSHRRGFA
jgi:hypothetical protein